MTAQFSQNHRKNQKNAIEQSMGEAWLVRGARSIGEAWIVRGLVWKISMLLHRNAHVGVLVPKSGTFPPCVYYHSNISK